MLDVHFLMTSYREACRHAEEVKDRIRRAESAMVMVPEAAKGVVVAFDDERVQGNIFPLKAQWKRDLFILNVRILLVEYALGLLTPEEVAVVELHFECGIPLVEMTKMDLSKSSIENSSLSTLKRCRKSALEKLTKELGETPLFPAV